MLVARLTLLSCQQTTICTLPFQDILLSLESTPVCPVGAMDQAQAHHHITTPAKTLAPHTPEGSMCRAHAQHR
ncbi:MAG: hypothetical protein ABI970_01685 [Chloroflexota bacterium]